MTVYRWGGAGSCLSVGSASIDQLIKSINLNTTSLLQNIFSVRIQSNRPSHETRENVKFDFIGGRYWPKVALPLF